MKRKRITPGGGGGDENGDGGTNKKRSSRNNRQKNSSPPPPPVIGTVATRTRRQKREMSTKWNQPISILITIMGYADPETIRMLCCVSKQFYGLIANDPGMEQNRAVPLLQISPAEDQDDEGRRRRLFQFLQHRRDKLQLYREIKIIDANKFSVSPHSGWMELKTIADTLRLYGVVSLDISNPTTPYLPDDWDYFICFLFSKILPNLRDVNFSNTGFPSASFRYFCTKCPNLEKITWHNSTLTTRYNLKAERKSKINIDGRDMMNATNLKYIYMDGSVFEVGDVKRDKLLDLENDAHSDIFLFHKFSSKLLERVSIRNAKWYVSYAWGNYYNTTVIPQNVLIKFVRKAPTSLRWFRSHLTEENMMMLRSERPGIELVN